MDFLVVFISIIIVAVFAKFFFKSIMVISILGIFIYIMSPANIKTKLDSIVSINKASNIANSTINEVFNIAKPSAVAVTKKVDEVIRK